MEVVTLKRYVRLTNFGSGIGISIANFHVSAIFSHCWPDAIIFMNSNLLMRPDPKNAVVKKGSECTTHTHTNLFNA